MVHPCADSRVGGFVFLLAAVLVAATPSFGAVPAAIDLFVAGEPPEVAVYRIPALVRTARGTLVAIAEARTTTTSDCDYKWLAFRRSTDNGTTWSDVAELWGKNLTKGQGAGNPAVVFDNVTGHIILHGSVNSPSHCSPSLWNFQLDDGGSDGAVWGGLRNMTSEIEPYAGATPGPGTGTQLGPDSPAPGRLLIAAHYGAYEKDVSWFSDDHGASWTLSTPPLENLDEVVVSALPSGRVLLNARTDHYNASCDCRAVTYSNDGGSTWVTPVQWDATLIEPVCQASMVTIGPLADAGGDTAIFFSNPASTTSREDITVRRSDDGGATWLPNTWLVQGGPTWGGYSCMAQGAPLTRADTGSGEYGAIIYEHALNDTNATDVISFSLFPVVMPPPAPAPFRTFIAASSSAFLWAGRRFLRGGDSNRVAFDFPGVTATVTTSGSTYFEAVFASTCTDPTRLESSVDGKPPLDTHARGSFWLYATDAMPHSIMLGSGLDPALQHTLQIRQAVEARWAGCGPNASVELAGVFTDGTPSASPALPARRIEWVGDSISAGFGAAPDRSHPSTPCPSASACEDPSHTAALGGVCLSLNATCAIVAVSGTTVIPTNASIEIAKPPLPLLYPRALTYDSSDAWNFSSWIPDAVVVNIGTNDAALPNFNVDYVPVLTAFLVNLSSQAGWYGGAVSRPPRALLYCGPMVHTYCGPMQSAVAGAVAAGADAAFLGLINATLDGCDGHPGPEGNAMMAKALSPLIQAAMGW